MRRVAVYCGSRFGRDPRYRDAAEALGAELARRGTGLVYGGASVGLMGAVAQGALDAGGEVIGVIPGALAARELQHPGLSAMHTVGSMHERKARMSELADAFVALPGGLGTLDELAEAMTWTQLGIHRKPCGLLDVAGFWAPFVAMMDGFVATGFVDPSQRALLVVDDDPVRLLDALAATVCPRASGGPRARSRSRSGPHARGGHRPMRGGAARRTVGAWVRPHPSSRSPTWPGSTAWAMSW